MGTGNPYYKGSSTEQSFYIGSSATPLLKLNFDGVTISGLASTTTTTPTSSILVEDSGIIKKIKEDDWHYVAEGSNDNDFQNSWVNKGDFWTQNLRYRKDLSGNYIIFLVY